MIYIYARIKKGAKFTASHCANVVRKIPRKYWLYMTRAACLILIRVIAARKIGDVVLS